MAINMDYGFDICWFSDINYNEMTVLIKFKGQDIAQINKDKGIDMLEIEIFTEYTHPDFIPIIQKFMLSDFLNALNEAIKILGG